MNVVNFMRRDAGPRRNGPQGKKKKQKVTGGEPRGEPQPRG